MVGVHVHLVDDTLLNLYVIVLKIQEDVGSGDVFTFSTIFCKIKISSIMHSEPQFYKSFFTLK